MSRATLRKCQAIVCGLYWLMQVYTTPAFSALEPKDVDAKLEKIMHRISKIATESSGEYERLDAANQELIKYIKSVCREPQVMNDPLKKAADAGLSVVRSDDKKLRYYSWDTLTGGTMHVFYTIVAYDAGTNQIKCEVLNPKSKDAEGDPAAFVDTLDTIRTKDGKTVYMMQELMIGSNIIHGRSINALTISNGKLMKYPFFQASKKLLDSISYDFAEYGDDTQIVISADKKTLKIPLIKPAAPDAPSSGTATGKYLNYYFNGYRYVFGKGK